MLCFILLNSCGAKNAVVCVLVGDDDSSTISKVRQNVEHEVEKWSDVVHAIKDPLLAHYTASRPKTKA